MSEAIFPKNGLAMSVTISATVLLRRVRSERASRLGRYPSLVAASWTRWRVAALIRRAIAPPARTRLAVLIEVFDSLAMSANVAGIDKAALPGGLQRKQPLRDRRRVQVRPSLEIRW